MHPRYRPFAAALVTLALVFGASRHPAAQSPASAPTTGVLTTLTVKPDVQRADIMKVMPNEVRDTVQLYLDGKIEQWFGARDGRGVVFILNCATVPKRKPSPTPCLSESEFGDVRVPGDDPLRRCVC